MNDLTPEQKIATILTSYGDCLLDDFFQKVDGELRKEGYQLECNQRGAFGTHIRVIKSERS